MEHLDATYSANNNEDRAKALNYLARHSQEDPQFIDTLSNLLSTNIASLCKDEKLVKMAICNFISKHVDKLLYTPEKLAQARRRLTSTLYQTLSQPGIVHRNKNVLTLALSKVLTNQFSK